MNESHSSGSLLSSVTWCLLPALQPFQLVLSPPLASTTISLSLHNHQTPHSPPSVSLEDLASFLTETVEAVRRDLHRPPQIQLPHTVPSPGISMSLTLNVFLFPGSLFSAYQHVAISHILKKKKKKQNLFDPIFPAGYQQNPSVLLPLSDLQF